MTGDLGTQHLQGRESQLWMEAKPENRGIHPDSGESVPLKKGKDFSGRVPGHRTCTSTCHQVTRLHGPALEGRARERNSQTKHRPVTPQRQENQELAAGFVRLLLINSFLCFTALSVAMVFALSFYSTSLHWDLCLR